MNDIPSDDVPPSEEEWSRPRGHPLVAWCVILVLVSLVVFLQQRRVEERPVKENVNRLQQKAAEQPSRWLIGQKEMTPDEATKESFKNLAREQIEALDRGPYQQRLKAVILAGELLGPTEALDQLSNIEQDRAQAESQEERSLRESLHRLYNAYSQKNYRPNVLSEAEKEKLRDELGWFGELALAPAEGPDKEMRKEVIAPVRRLVLGAAAAVLGGLAVLLLGFVILVVLLVLLFTGKLRRGFVPGSPHGGIYVETFALWMVLFIGLTVLSAFIPAGRSHLLVGGLLSLLSLTALAWPVWRGIPWRQVREEVGLHSGRGPMREVASGFVCYVAALPMVVAGVIVMLVLLAFLKQHGGGAETPTHPVFELVGEDAWVRLQILLVASLTAPLVEETMFRGVFYRHLREATRGWGFALSFLASALVNGLIFAVIHPQGLIAVPVLTALALGFTLAREWRGSLIPCMVAHGFSNALVTLFVFSTLAD